MDLKFSFYIGYRYWRARKSNNFASFITFFAVSGIFLGVAALIIVSSVMGGLEGQLKNRILGAVPQLSVHAQTPIENWGTLAEKLTKIEGVKGSVPSAETQAMVQSAKNISAVQIYGIYPEKELNISAIATHTYLPDFKSLTSGSYRVLLGSVLANKLRVGVGDKVRLLSGDGVVYSPLGPMPSQRLFEVAGVFNMGSQVDANVAYIHYEDARRLMRKAPTDIEDLRLFLNDPFQAPALTPLVEQLLADNNITASVTDWRNAYGHLFSAVKMEKNMMSLMLSLIVAVAAFNIVSALVMMVVDKNSDIAILKTQGLTRTNIMMIFIVQGSLNAVIGLVLGGVLGLLFTYNINPILSSLGVHVLGAGQSLPVVVQSSQLFLIGFGTLLITFFATLYPAIRAALVQPAATLRYE